MRYQMRRTRNLERTSGARIMVSSAGTPQYSCKHVFNNTQWKNDAQVCTLKKVVVSLVLASWVFVSSGEATHQFMTTPNATRLKNTSSLIGEPGHHIPPTSTGPYVHHKLSRQIERTVGGSKNGSSARVLKRALPFFAPRESGNVSKNDAKFRDLSGGLERRDLASTEKNNPQHSMQFDIDRMAADNHVMAMSRSPSNDVRYKNPPRQTGVSDGKLSSREDKVHSIVLQKHEDLKRSKQRGLGTGGGSRRFYYNSSRVGDDDLDRHRQRNGDRDREGWSLHKDSRRREGTTSSRLIESKDDKDHEETGLRPIESTNDRRYGEPAQPIEIKKGKGYEETAQPVEVKEDRGYEATSRHIEGKGYDETPPRPIGGKDTRDYEETAPRHRQRLSPSLSARRYPGGIVSNSGNSTGNPSARSADGQPAPRNTHTHRRKHETLEGDSSPTWDKEESIKRGMGDPSPTWDKEESIKRGMGDPSPTWDKEESIKRGMGDPSPTWDKDESIKRETDGGSNPDWDKEEPRSSGEEGAEGGSGRSTSYRSKFSIEELLHRRFQHRISNDIYMDPCKAGGFLDDIALPNSNYERELQLQNIKDALYLLNHPEEAYTADHHHHKTPAFDEEGGEEIDEEEDLDRQVTGPKVSAVLSHPERGGLNASLGGSAHFGLANYTQELRGDKETPVGGTSSRKRPHHKHHSHRSSYHDGKHPHKHFSGLHHERNLRLARQRLREKEALRVLNITVTSQGENSSATYSEALVHPEEELHLHENVELDPILEMHKKILGEHIRKYNDELDLSTDVRRLQHQQSGRLLERSGVLSDDPNVGFSSIQNPDLEDTLLRKRETGIGDQHKEAKEKAETHENHLDGIKSQVKRESRLPAPYDRTHHSPPPSGYPERPRNQGFLSQVDRSHDNLETAEKKLEMATELPIGDEDRDKPLVVDISLPEHVKKNSKETTPESELMLLRKNNLRKARLERRQFRKMHRESAQKFKRAKILNKPPKDVRYFASPTYFDDRRREDPSFYDDYYRKNADRYGDVYANYYPEDHLYGGYIYNGNPWPNNVSGWMYPRQTGLDGGLLPFYSSDKVRGKIPDAFYEKELLEVTQQRGYLTPASEEEPSNDEERPKLVNKVHSPSVLRRKMARRYRNRNRYNKHSHRWNDRNNNRNSRRKNRDKKRRRNQRNKNKSSDWDRNDRGYNNRRGDRQRPSQTRYTPQYHDTYDRNDPYDDPLRRPDYHHANVPWKSDKPHRSRDGSRTSDEFEDNRRGKYDDRHVDDRYVDPETHRSRDRHSDFDRDGYDSRRKDGYDPRVSDYDRRKDTGDDVYDSRNYDPHSTTRDWSHTYRGDPFDTSTRDGWDSSTRDPWDGSTRDSWDSSDRHRNRDRHYPYDPTTGQARHQFDINRNEDLDPYRNVFNPSSPDLRDPYRVDHPRDPDGYRHGTYGQQDRRDPYRNTDPFSPRSDDPKTVRQFDRSAEEASDYKQQRDSSYLPSTVSKITQHGNVTQVTNSSVTVVSSGREEGRGGRGKSSWGTGRVDEEGAGPSRRTRTRRRVPRDRCHHHGSCHRRQRRRGKRAATARKERVWEHGVIPYIIDTNFTGADKGLFKRAMRHWENYTCVKFVEKTDDHPNYIIFTVRECGCCSFVGKRGNGPQAISIGKNCDKFGIVVHELGHVVGFWHEHTRPDRENHVEIIRENIQAGQDYNFNKLTGEEVNSLGQRYDFGSIMHYARATFAKATYLDTIRPREEPGVDSLPEIGQRVRLSEGDIAQTNLLYNCPSGCWGAWWGVVGPRSVKRVLVECGGPCRVVNEAGCAGRLCGSILLPYTVVSQGSRLLVTYVASSHQAGRRGFEANYEAVCGGELEQEGGRLESPNYPDDYRQDKECVWLITVPEGYQVALRFHSFEIENHDECVYDYLDIRDGHGENDTLLGVYCGYKLPDDVKSISNKMRIKFVTDGSVQKAGFSATFMKEYDECASTDHGCGHRCINQLGGYECQCNIGYELHSDGRRCEDACGGPIESSNGSITSPSFPDLYPINKNCIWEIIAPPQYRITLNFTHFDLEGNNQDCEYDSVEVRSRLGDMELRKHGVFCGQQLPPVVTSDGNSLRVEFTSDNSVQKSGFAAVFFTDKDECAQNNGGCQHICKNSVGSYQCSCHNGFTLHENGHDCKEGGCKHELTASVGQAFSPNYPDYYPSRKNCVWHFTTTPGHRIKLVFDEFEMEPHQECTYDYIILYDGTSPQAAKLGRYCGAKVPHPIIASTNQMFMIFKSDSSVQRKGFRATHSTVCGGHLQASEGSVRHMYSHAKYGDQNYDNKEDCDWIIEAPPGKNVHLTFLTFELEDEHDCGYDYVEVFSGYDDTAPSYGQFCGNSIPQEIVSMDESLLVRFRSDDTINTKGFSAAYVATDADDSSENTTGDHNAFTYSFSRGY